jgi:pimeloyl-ACP methyl ester carboxylesterase
LGARIRLALQAVVPSRPGFGFSGRPRETGWNLSRMADALHWLMAEVLGFTRYAVRGSDWGLSLALILGARYPDHIAGVHVGGTHLRVTETPRDASAEERRFVSESRRWYEEEAAYNDLQATKPQTIGAALNDSPVGLLTIPLIRAMSQPMPIP